MAAPPPLSFAAAEVRRHDRDRFITALFASADRREHLFGLYAFNLEVAKVREVTREATIGLIRLQWWRDAIAGMAAGGPKPAQPVATALGEAIEAHGLPLELFERLLEGRERDLGFDPPNDLAELEAYAEATSASLTQLALKVLRADATVAGRHVGIAWALVGLLRAMPYHASEGRMYLPQGLLAEHDLSIDDVFAGRKAVELQNAAKVVAARAAEHLRLARAQRVPRGAVPALLPAKLADRYLRRLAAVDYNLYDGSWSAVQPAPLRLGMAALRGRF